MYFFTVLKARSLRQRSTWFSLWGELSSRPEKVVSCYVLIRLSSVGDSNTVNLDLTCRITALNMSFNLGLILSHPHPKHIRCLLQWLSFYLEFSYIYLLLFIFIFDDDYIVFVVNSYNSLLYSYFCRFLILTFEERTRCLFYLYF